MTEAPSPDGARLGGNGAPLDAPSAASLLEVAVDVGSRLTASARWTSGRCTWPIRNSVASPDLRQWRPATGVLYNGTAGIALFLSELHSIQPNPALERTIDGALNYALHLAGNWPRARLGYFDGLTGVAHVAARIGTLRGDASRVEAARTIVASLQLDDAVSAGCDVISGAAGAIPALLRLAELTGDERSRYIAMELGRHVLRVARREPTGWSWDTPAPWLSRNPTGWAHGASGVAGALVDLYAAFGEEAFLYAAEQALTYESQFFDGARGTWRNERRLELIQVMRGGQSREFIENLLGGEEPPVVTPQYQVQWCYGGPGMAAVRLRVARVTGDQRWVSEAEAALCRAEASLAANTYSLCHGAVGNAECLLHAATIDDRRELATRVRRWALAIPGWYWTDRAAWRSGGLDGGDEPTLMLGEAGLGYFCLRAADPSIPSPLFVDVATPLVRPPSPEWRVAHEADYAETFFECTLAAFRALGVPLPTARDISRTRKSSAPVALLHLLCEAVERCDEECRELLTDVVELDRNRLELITSVDDYVPMQLTTLLRSEFPTAWAFVPLHSVQPSRIVISKFDWRGWLGTVSAQRSAVPQRVNRRLLLFIHQWEVAELALDGVQEAILSALQRPCSLLELTSGTALPGTEPSERAVSDATIADGVHYLYRMGVLSPIGCRPSRPTLVTE